MPPVNNLEGRRLRLLMLPWLAHGHVSPFLELAKRLSQKNMEVHLCSTPINLASIREEEGQHLDSSIHLVELHLSSLPTLPPHLHTTKYLPPHLMPTLKEAFDLAEPSFDRLLKTLRPDFLFYDFIQPWAPAAAHRRGIPAVQFLTTGAASLAFFMHYLTKKRSISEAHDVFPFPAMSFGSLQEDLEYVRMFDRVANRVSEEERLCKCLESSSSFIAVKSFSEIESKYIHYLSQLLGKEMVPTGPLVPAAHGGDNHHQFIDQWLDTKARSSVVYVSVGSEYFMSRDEMEEIARGLELSEVHFVWVVRFPKDNEGDETDGRSGFLEGVVGEEGKGLVVEGWAPQRRILAHRSVGGFVTHCGWSSVMEGMRFGVPMVALPRQLDQPFNAKLVAELGVGVEVEVETVEVGGVRRRFFKGEQLGNEIRKVVMSKEGEGMRKKVKEMAEKMHSRGDEDIEVLVEKMIALCK